MYKLETTTLIHCDLETVWNYFSRPENLNDTDWTSVIVQSLLRQMELNICIHRHLLLYDFSNIGLFYKSQWYELTAANMQYRLDKCNTE